MITVTIMDMSPLSARVVAVLVTRLGRLADTRLRAICAGLATAVVCPG